MLTVAICTWNRASQLKLVLEDLAADWRVERGPLEVVVIDNNSTDNTRAVVAALADALPVRWVLEPRQGLSFARNRAIVEARGPVLIYLDDDVRVHAGWLAAYRAAFIDPTVIAAGGRIIPVWPERVPRWVGTNPTPPFSTIAPHFNLGDSVQRVTDPEHIPVTANLGFRRDVIQSLGGFREDLGHFGKKATGGEDIELLQRLLRRNDVILYLPGAIVDHPVEPARLKLGFNFGYLHRGGIAQSRYEPPPLGTRMAFGVPTWALRRIAQSAGRSVGAFARGDLRESVIALGRIAVLSGYARGVRTARRA